MTYNCCITYNDASIQYEIPTNVCYSVGFMFILHSDYVMVKSCRQEQIERNVEDAEFQWQLGDHTFPSWDWNCSHSSYHSYS